MTSDDESESTFADVFNGLTMGAGRPRKRRGRPEPQQDQHRAPQPEAVPLFEEGPREEYSSTVRAYAWTGGRTRTNTQLEIETLISTTGRAAELMHTMRSEHQAVAGLCRSTKSVAEIGALLSLPLGVVRVLLDDMAGLGLVTVHSNHTSGDGQPDMDLLQRVLRGLTNLRS
jgi:Protein of unknown function (DUF742)